MLNDIYAVVAALGGDETVAAITGFTAHHVLIWRNRGWLPTVTYPQIRYNLLARGLDVDKSLFGPRQVETPEKNFIGSVSPWDMRASAIHPL